MLQNAYLLAKIGADTAENERHIAENLPKIGNSPTGPPPEAAAAEALDLLFPLGLALGVGHDLRMPSLAQVSLYVF